MKILLNKDDLNEALNSVSNLGFIPPWEAFIMVIYH